MRAGDRSARDVLIEQLHRDGIGPTAIGRRVGIRPARVRTILLSRGVAERQPLGVTEGIWDADRETRLAAFYERQRQGARAALEGASA